MVCVVGKLNRISAPVAACDPVGRRRRYVRCLGRARSVESSFDRGGGACVLSRTRSSHPWALRSAPSMAPQGPRQHAPTSASDRVSIARSLESERAPCARSSHRISRTPVPGTGVYLFIPNEGATLDAGRATGDRCGGASPIAGPSTDHPSPTRLRSHHSPQHRSPVAQPDEIVTPATPRDIPPHRVSHRAPSMRPLTYFSRRARQ